MCLPKDPPAYANPVLEKRWLLIFDNAGTALSTYPEVSPYLHSNRTQRNLEGVLALGGEGLHPVRLPVSIIRSWLMLY